MHTSAERSTAAARAAGPARAATVCQMVLSLEVGGAEVLAREIARQAQGGFPSVFACLDRMGPLGASIEQQGGTVEVLQRRPGIDVRCAWRIRRFCRAHQVGLIHAHLFGPFFYSALARLFSLPVPILYTEHGFIGPEHPARAKFAARLLLRRGDRVVAVSEAVRGWLVDTLGFPAARTGVVYNGIELPPGENPAPRRAEVRRSLGLRDDEVVIIQVGRLTPVKNHALALAAMERLAESSPRTRLVVAGDGSERPALESSVRRRGLGDRVMLLGMRSDVGQLLQAADVAILTSHSEGMPLALIEAMGAGLPCVATRVGGCGEVVADGETGLLVAPNQPDAFAAGLGRLIAEPGLRRCMGEAGRRRAERLFDARSMHQAYQDLYREMLGPRRS